MTPVILVIDNESSNRKLVRDLLTYWGYTIIEAADGEQGIQQAIAAKPNLIFLEIQLTGLDGYEVMARLKRDPRTNAIPVAALTSLAMTGDRERILEAGCCHYIPKPIDTRALVAWVKEQWPLPEKQNPDR